MKFAARLDSQWKAAQSAGNRQQLQEAEKLLVEIVQSYDKGLHVSFDLEAAKLELAGVYLRQNCGLKAKYWIIDVQKSTSDKTWQSKADGMLSKLPAFSCKDAFEGRTIGVYCCRRTNGSCNADPQLTQDLTERLMKDGIKTVMLPVSDSPLGEPVDATSAKPIADGFMRIKADAVFVAVLDIDASKTGTQVSIPFTTEKVDALDAKMRYMILRTADGAILASDSTAGYSQAVSGMLTAVLTHPRHLPGHAVVIAEGLTRVGGGL